MSGSRSHLSYALKKAQWIILLTLFYLVFLPVYASSELFSEVTPDPVYLPEEVVGLQMRALAKNDSPYNNAGIELTFRFASPANKSMTGPLEKFSGLFELTDYQPMLNHQSLEIGPTRIQENNAFVPVIIRTRSDEKIGYLFRLSRQSDSPFENCWMTDGVARVNLTDEGQTM